MPGWRARDPGLDRPRCPRPDGQAEGGLRIDLEGELAGILALATEHKGVGGGTDLRGQAKLVAGTGFEPVTFRL
jgi:hypothetical protein